MQRVPVDSSSIASIGYAPEQQVLELEFRQSGEVYQYFNVPAEEHTAFLAADSKGTYLNRHFKPRQYRYHRVRPQQELAPASRSFCGDSCWCREGESNPQGPKPGGF
jgi:hypothetical protein